LNFELYHFTGIIYALTATFHTNQRTGPLTQIHFFKTVKTMQFYFSTFENFTQNTVFSI